MMLFNPSCRECGRTMHTVADIAPLGAEPGLRAFICERCRVTDSVLIPPERVRAPSVSAEAR